MSTSSAHNPTMASARRSLALVFLLIALLTMSAACGGDDTDGSTTTASSDEAPDATTDEAFDSYIGLSEEEAGAAADAEGRPWRVVERDGESLPVTMDLVEDRLNFVIVDGNVTAVTTG